MSSSQYAKDHVMKCQKCSAQFTVAERYAHMRDVHGYKSGRPPGSITNSSSSQIPAIERLRNYKLELNNIIRDMENERDGLHRKVLELDNIIAEHKKLLVKA